MTERDKILKVLNIYVKSESCRFIRGMAHIAQRSVESNTEGRGSRFAVTARPPEEGVSRDGTV